MIIDITIMTKISNTINVAEVLASIISSRDVANVLKEAIIKTNAKLVNLDFSNVEFVSRSAAHELSTLKEKLHQKTFNKKEIAFINTNQAVTEMLRVVAANRMLPKIKKPDFTAEKTDIYSLLKEVKV